MKTASSAESLRLIVVAQNKSKLFLVLINLNIQEVNNAFENVFKNQRVDLLTKEVSF